MEDGGLNGYAHVQFPHPGQLVGAGPGVVDEIVAVGPHVADLGGRLKRVQSHVGRCVAHSVAGELPVVLLGLAGHQLQLLGGDGGEAPGLGHVFVGLPEVGGAHGRDAVQKNFNGVELEHLVAEAAGDHQLLQPLQVLGDGAAGVIQEVHQVGAVVELALLLGLVVGAHLLRGQVGVNNAGDAVFVKLPAHELNHPDVLLGGELGDAARHGGHGPGLVENAGEGARGVPVVHAAVGVGGVFADARQFQRPGVAHGDMVAQAHAVAGVVGADPVQLAAGGHLLVGPAELVPLEALHPLAGLYSFRLGGQGVQHVLLAFAA